MKQHITVDQLEKLTDDQVCKLNTLMKNVWDYITYEEVQKLSWKDILEDTAKFCTIGKMIEVISNFVYDIETFQGHGYWDAIVEIKTDKGNKKYEAEWLCDALWKCLKDVALDMDFKTEKEEANLGFNLKIEKLKDGYKAMLKNYREEIENLKEKNQLLESDMINSEMNLKIMTGLYERSQAQNRELATKLRELYEQSKRNWGADLEIEKLLEETDGDE